jgi:putative membrane protein
MTEALLAFVHFTAVLALVVFATSEAALTRVEWLNAAVVARLVRVDWLCRAAAVAVILSGLARIYFGAKGAAWYWQQPLLYAKLVVFVMLVALSLSPTREFQRWARNLAAGGGLPDAAAVQAVRRRVLTLTHLLIIVPLFAALLARGVGTVGA